MLNCLGLRWLSIAVGLVALVSAPAFGESGLVRLGPMLPTGLSADGSVAVGSSVFNGSAYYRWTAGTGTVAIGGAFVGGRARVSADGHVVLGGDLRADGEVAAALWTASSGWAALDGIAAQGCAGVSSFGYDLSDDGSVVVGQAFDGCATVRAFRWTADEGSSSIGAVVEDRASAATAVSGDGSIPMGWSDQRAGTRSGAVWTTREGVLEPEWIRDDSGRFVGQVNDVNSDGSVVVGSFPCGERNGAYRVVESSGVACIGYVRDLPDGQLPFRTRALATSDDGSVIGGATGFSFTSDAVVWIDGKPRLLQFFLKGRGIDASGWSLLAEVTAVSADGRVIAGWGLGPSFAPEGFLIRLQ